MATRGKTLPERISRWKVITVGLKPLLPEMPHVVDLHGQLTQAITQSEDLNARSEALRSEAQDVNRQRDDLARTGDDLRQRLGAALRTQYGFKSEKLIEFGLNPRRARGKAKKTPAPAPTPAPVPAAGGGTGGTHTP
jgi:hypothetical protein